MNALTGYSKPLPRLDPLIRPFWEHARAGPVDRSDL